LKQLNNLRTIYLYEGWCGQPDCRERQEVGHFLRRELPQVHLIIPTGFPGSDARSRLPTLPPHVESS
jgi:hypothetical protein